MTAAPMSFNDRVIEEFRANNGNVTSNGFGRSLVLVHHIGAKSGTPRVTPLVSFPAAGGGWLIAASKGGAPENPSWFHNLRAHPETVIEAPDDGEVEVLAEELHGEERGAAWAQFTTGHEVFAGYERTTARTIPLVRLTRR